MIMKGDSQLDAQEMDFFLKGNTSLDQVKRKKTQKWISESGWKDMQKLSEMQQRWGNLFNDVIDNERDWKNWSEQIEPEKTPIPCGYSDWLTPF